MRRSAISSHKIGKRAGGKKEAMHQPSTSLILALAVLLSTINWQPARPLSLILFAQHDDEAERRQDQLLSEAMKMAGTDQYDEAIADVKSALSIIEKIDAPNIQHVAKPLYLGIVFNTLGFLYYSKGDYQQAEQWYLRKLALDKEFYSKERLPTPDFVEDLFHLGLLYQAKGDSGRAISYFAKANEKEDQNLFEDSFLDLPESEKVAVMNLLTFLTDTTISLHVKSAASNPSAVRLALTTIIRRKGRVLDMLSSDIATLQRRLKPEDQSVFQQYVRALTVRRSAMGGLVTTRDPKSQLDAIQKAEGEVKRLEKELQSKLTYLYHSWEPESLYEVQQALPADGALVEIVLYRPFDASATENNTRWSAPHYIGYVLQPQGDPQVVDLGVADKIDAAVGLLREELQGPEKPSVRRAKQLGKALDRLTIGRIRPLLNNKHRVFLSPDGKLNLIPFGALVDENNHYLIEHHSFSYLTSGRDLMRFKTAVPSKSGPLIVGNANFNGVRKRSPVLKAPGRTNSRAARLRLSSKGTDDIGAQPDENGCLSEAFRPGGFDPLPGTVVEAKKLHKLLRGSTLLTEEKATEGALGQVSGPSILHLATHGSFLPDVQPERKSLTAEQEWFKLRFPTTAALHGPKIENMLLRSYIALAGANLARANQRQSGCDDGILTALELSMLDLWGTKLAFLSACETGLGEVQNGEGVYGLRRALTIAGSESQVITLWSIDDASTQALIIEYYRELRSGMDRCEGLRQAQLAILHSRNKALTHPFFWAPFIQSGAWDKIDLRHLN
jgi:CHAT domain-containing protein